MAELSFLFPRESAEAGRAWLRLLCKRGLDAQGRITPEGFTAVVGRGADGHCVRTASLSLPVEKLGGPEQALVGALQRMCGLERPVPGPAQAGYDYAAANFPDPGLRLPDGDGVPRASLDGLSASLFGAMDAGCRFAAWALQDGPPAWFPGFERAPGAERAVSMALGAAHAGARSMAVVPAGEMEACSGTLRWAAEAEVPLVVLCAGEGFGIVPSMAEWVESAPAAFFAPAGVEEAGRAAARAFDWAEVYQCPVCVSLAGLGGLWSPVRLPERAEASRGLWAQPGEGRYLDAATGISPRAVPGQEGLEHLAGPADEARARKLGRKHVALLSSGPGLSVQGSGPCVVASGSLAGELRRMEGRFKLAAVDRLLPFPSAVLSVQMQGSPKTVIAEWEGDAALRGLIRRGLNVDLPSVQFPRGAGPETLREVLAG